MPNYLKPVIKATPEQMKAILERIVSRRSTPKLTPKAGGMDPRVMQGAIESTPQNENVYGQLLDRANPDRPITKTMPINDAMNSYMNDPERYSALPVGPPARHAFTTPPSNNPYDMSMGIANERMTFKSPVPGGIRNTQASIINELARSAAPKEMPGVVAPQGARNTIKTAIAKSSIGEVTALAARLEDLWKSMDGGGGRSGIGKMWKMYLEGSNMRGKVKNAKDYFIASAVRAHNDPIGMAKQFPREKKLLDNMKVGYSQKVGIDLDTGLPIGGE